MCLLYPLVLRLYSIERVCALTEQTPDGSFVVVPVLSSDGLLVAVRSWPMEKWEGRSEWNVSTEQTAFDGLEALALDSSF